MWVLFFAPQPSFCDLIFPTQLIFFFLKKKPEWKNKVASNSKSFSVQIFDKQSQLQINEGRHIPLKSQPVISDLSPEKKTCWEQYENRVGFVKTAVRCYNSTGLLQKIWVEKMGSTCHQNPMPFLKPVLGCDAILHFWKTCWRTPS